MARKPLFLRLPESWKYQDSKENVTDGKGVLERYLEIWDNSFDRSESLADEVMASKDTNRVQDRFLRIVGSLCGHRWKDYRSYQWNRQRIRELISRYSYKGTAVAIADLVYEHGSSFCEIVDMASLVGAWNVQGTVEEDNCYFFDADFFHPGVFLVYLSETVDMPSFKEDFSYCQSAGTKWYFYIKTDLAKTPVVVSSVTDIVVHMELTPRNRIAVFNESVFAGGGQRSLLIDIPD